MERFSLDERPRVSTSKKSIYFRIHIHTHTIIRVEALVICTLRPLFLCIIKYVCVAQLNIAN